MMEPEKYQAEALQSTSGYSFAERRMPELLSEFTAASDLTIFDRLIREQREIKAQIMGIMHKLAILDNMLSEIRKEIREIRDNLSERIVVVREIPFEEAKKMAEEYIMKKKDDYIDPLEIAEALQIPYEQAHEIFLQLVEEGKLKLEE